MNTIIINGKLIQASGNLHIGNGRIVVNGQDVTPDDNEIINITINGNVDSLQVDSCYKVSITGNASTVRTTSGDIDIQGNVSGGVQTVSGDVDCGNVSGSISTVSGNIKHKR